MTADLKRERRFTSEACEIFVGDRTETDLGMSNFDYEIDPGLEEALRAGQWGHHHGENFNSIIIFDDGKFKAMPHVYHNPQAVIEADTLGDLMSETNDQYGAA